MLKKRKGNKISMTKLEKFLENIHEKRTKKISTVKKKIKKVLLIEDDKYLAADLRYFIEDKGHEITICSNTNEILQIYPEIDTYDTIILGLMMLKGETFLESEKEKEEEKKLDVGEILYKRIRKQYPNKNIVILTSKNKENVAVKIGNTKFVQKPLIENKLIELLKYIG